MLEPPVKRSDIMDGINPPTRLRNACDECHKLKRRCTGTMPCEKCTSLGSLCFYSVVSRLGRPPGSRSQRRAQAKSPPVQKRGPSPDQNHEATSASFDTDSMMDFNVDNFDTTSLYELFINSTQSPGAAPNPFSAAGSEADVLQDIDRLPALDTSYLKQPNTGTITPVSLSPEQGRQQQQQQQQQQQLRLVKQLPDPRSWALFLQQQQQQQQQQQAQRQTQQSPRHIRSTPSSSCQCIPNLSSLLHDLKRTEDDKMPQVSLDTVLARTSDAIAQWSAFASCPRCQNNDGEDDDGETLLLAALTMRRVVALLKASDLQPGVSKENDEVEGKDVGPQLQFGTFRIAGSDRTMLLRVLRTITFRKLDTFVTSMQSMLRSKQTQHSGADDAILNHIKAILVELAKMVKVQ